MLSAVDEARLDGEHGCRYEGLIGRILTREFRQHSVPGLTKWYDGLNPTQIDELIHKTRQMLRSLSKAISLHRKLAIVQTGGGTVAILSDCTQPPSA
jgi:hypothetical protein